MDSLLRRLGGRVRALPGLLGRAPRWLSGLIGAVVLAIGVLIVLRPLTSITLLCYYVAASLIISGIADLASSRDARRWYTIVTAVASIVVGICVAVFFRGAVALLPVLLPIVLMLWGVTHAVAVFRRGAVVSQRVLAGALALAEIALGAVALLWPDITLTVVAVLFAVRAIVFGLSLLVRAIWPHWQLRAPQRALPVLRWTGAILVLALAAGAFAGSQTLRAGAPVLDDFYATPAEVPAEPGALLRSEPYTANVPDGVTAWRILYTTTNADDSPALASGIVVIPGAQGSGPYPVIAIAHGTIGIARACAMSLGDIAVSEDAIPAMSQVFANGWAVVATDYTGQGAEGKYPYLVGESEARSNLDAVRAARQLTSLTDQTVLWGHSQGGHAALWTSMIAADYAPDVPITATAAFSPASDPYNLALKILASGSSLANIVTAYVAVSYAGVYPELNLDDYVNPAAIVLVREMAARCANSAETLATLISAMAVGRDSPVFSVDLSSGDFADRLQQNLAAGPFEGPVFIAQGTDDEVIPIALQRQFVADRCADGQDVLFREYEGRTHMGILAADSPFPYELIAWTKAAFAGAAPASNCGG